MTAIEINMEDFKKWAGGQPLVVYTDMNAEMQVEAIDYVATGIEKSMVAGVLNQEAGCKFVKD